MITSRFGIYGRNFPWACPHQDKGVLVIKRIHQQPKAHVGKTCDMLTRDGVSKGTCISIIGCRNSRHFRGHRMVRTASCSPEHHTVQSVLSSCRFWAELLFRQAARCHWTFEGISRGDMGLWSGWLRRRRLLKPDSEPQIRIEPHIR